MDCKGYNIKVVEGNEFALLLTLKKRTFTASRPIDEDIDPTALENCVVKVNGVEYTPSIDEQGVTVIMPATLKRTTYNIELTATYQGSAIRAAYFEAFTIVAWNEQSDAQQYIQGSPVVLEPAYIIGGTLTDAELEQLKQEYREKIAAAEAAKEAADQAKEDFDEKAEALDNLDNVAQQGTNANATLTNTQAAAIAANQYGQTINNKIGDPQSGQADTLFGAIANINIDTSTIAKQGTNASATLTATQTAATNAYASAEAAKTGVVEGNDTAISVAKEIRSEVGTGSDTAAESGTLFAVLKWVKDKVKSIFNLIGSPASGQPATLFAAIAAGGGGGGDAQESTSQEILSRIGSAGSGQSTTLFGAIGDVALSAQTLQSLADSWAAMVTNRQSVDGYTFQNGYQVTGSPDILFRKDILKSINDTTTVVISGFTCLRNSSVEDVTMSALESVTGQGAFLNCTSLKTFVAPLLSSITNTELLSGCSSIESVNLPSLLKATQGGVFTNCTSLKKIQMPLIQSFSNSSMFSGCTNLIDIELGQNISANFSMASWNPTNALSSSSSSLVEPGETFANNLEKLLYNIREHIAANLPDRTGFAALTITFHANVKAAIQADTTTANAFSNKNWTIA